MARLPLFDPAGLQALALPGAERAALDRRVRACDRLTQAGADHKLRSLVRLGRTRLTKTIERASNGHQGADRAEQWLDAARAAVELYADHRAVAFVDLAAEVATEVRLLRAILSELAAHAVERERCYRWVDPAGLARSLPGLAEVGGPALVAAMGDPARFRRGRQFRSFTDDQSRALEAQANGATFPRTHRRPCTGAPSTTRTSVRLDEPLDSDPP